MNIEEFRDYCLSLPAVWECMPFGGDTLVFKVGDASSLRGSIFALGALDRAGYVLLKCDPDLAVSLREKYNCIEPGWHMNKRHWNGVYIDSGEITADVLRQLIDHSYEAVVVGLPVAVRGHVRNST